LRCLPHDDLRLSASLALLLAVSCARPRSTDPIILALGEEVVRRSDFERHVTTLELQGGGPLDPAAREALLEQFLEDRAMILEARSRGLLAPGSTAVEENAAIQKLLASAVPLAEVSEAEIASEYAGRPDEYLVPETVTLRQILLPTDNEARDVLRRLQQVPRNFESLARTRSRAPEAASGGLMGTFARGQLPADLEERAFSLAVGATSSVIESPLGFHILRVETREPERPLGLDECRERIRAKLQRQRADHGVREFVRGLMARAKVNHEAAKAAPYRS
jgi:peptidyl-prolyl cis-trans isomerase C